jgi:hypothetical protein
VLNPGGEVLSRPPSGSMATVSGIPLSPLGWLVGLRGNPSRLAYWAIIMAETMGTGGLGTF